MQISRREFARREGVSEKTIRNAIDHGALPVLDNGTLDSALVGTGWRKVRTGAELESPQQSRRQSAPDTTELTPAEIDAALAGRELVSLAEAQRRKEKFEALLRQLAYEEKSRRLVDRAEVEKTVFKLAREHRDRWQKGREGVPLAEHDEE
jgi:hypothetical protein